MFTCAAKEEPLTPHKEDKTSEHCEGIQLLSVLPDGRPSINLLQQLSCVRHPVNDDGNCLYDSIAHPVNGNILNIGLPEIMSSGTVQTEQSDVIKAELYSQSRMEPAGIYLFKGIKMIMYYR